MIEKKSVKLSIYIMDKVKMFINYLWNFKNAYLNYTLAINT